MIGRLSVNNVAAIKAIFVASPILSMNGLWHRASPPVLKICPPRDSMHCRKQRVVARQRAGHGLALRFPQPRAAFDVGEQERQRAARQRWHIGTWPGRHSGFGAGHDVWMVFVHTA